MTELAVNGCEVLSQMDQEELYRFQRQYKINAIHSLH